MPLQEVKAGDDRVLQDIADVLVKSHKVVLITGAGISTSCGIPDFRSKDGLYNLIPEQSGYPTPPASEPPTPTHSTPRKRKAYTTDDEDESFSSQASTSSRPRTPLRGLRGQDLFDSRIWSNEASVKVFYQFIASLRQKIRDEVKDTSPTHKFIRTLRDGGRLMRCYTQNIDGLESRDGLVMDMTYGKGNKRRFMKKNYEAPLPEQTSNTDFDAGVEVVQLHGDLDTLRCSYCQRITEWTDEASEIYLEGMAPKCKKCTESSKKRQSTGKRGLSVGTMRPNIVLYGESNPADHIIGPLVPFDIASGPEVLLIMGTSLKVHGLKKVIRDFAKAVHLRKDKGRVIFVNRESPAESIWDGIIDDYVSMDCDDWVQDLRTRREDLWLRQGELDLKVTKPATKRKRKSTDSDTTQPAKRQKITVEIPKRVMTPKKARANATMAITNMLNPGPTPGKRRPPPLFTPEMQLKHTLQQAQPDEAVDTPSKSRTWKRPNIDSPTRRILSPLAQQQRPDYSPIGQPQFTVHPDEQNHLTKSRTFKKPTIDSPTRKMLSPLMQRQPSFSPLHMSFKPFKRTECTIMLKSPERPKWSPISTPVRTPSKSKLRVFRDVDEAGGPKIQESDQEEDNEARRAREGSVKENSVPDIESESTETEPGVEAVGIGMLPMARSTRSRRQLTWAVRPVGGPDVRGRVMEMNCGEHGSIP